MMDLSPFQKKSDAMCGCSQAFITQQRPVIALQETFGLAGLLQWVDCLRLPMTGVGQDRPFSQGRMYSRLRLKADQTALDRSPPDSVLRIGSSRPKA
jgi:hypothetical protein